MKNIATHLDDVFSQNACEHKAAGMAAYMKNKFMYYGLTSPERRELQNPILSLTSLPPIDELHEVVELLWDFEARELQYTALDLVEKYMNHFRLEDLGMLEFMASHKQWWDTIDAIASKLMGAYFRRFPEERSLAIERWLASGDIWLQRCGILFQLKYKGETNTALLEAAILPVRQSNEFFIQKAIGWVLREYRKTDRHWVDNFIVTHDLKPLSKREAWKHRAKD